MSREIRTRVENVSWHPAKNETAVTVRLPGQHKIQRGEIIVLVLNEGTKADQAAIQAEQAEHLRKFYA